MTFLLGLLKSPLFLKAMGALAVLGVVLFLWERTPVIGPGARIARIETDRTAWRNAARDWEANSRAWKASFKEAERLRAAEYGAAVQAVNDGQKTCDARVKQARASAKIIKEIVNEPVKIDAGGCPVRGSIDAGRLRDALQAPGR